MLAALHQRKFAFLWFGQVISLIGDWVLFVALPFYVYSLTGSTLATGIMFIVQTIPSILLVLLQACLLLIVGIENAPCSLPI